MLGGGNQGIKPGHIPSNLLLAGSSYPPTQTQEAPAGLPQQSQQDPFERLMRDPLFNVSLSLMQAGTPRPQRVGLGDSIASGLQRTADLRKAEELAGGRSPMSVQEYEYYESLSPDDKRQYLSVKRSGISQAELDYEREALKQQVKSKIDFQFKDAKQEFDRGLQKVVNALDVAEKNSTNFIKDADSAIAIIETGGGLLSDAAGGIIPVMSSHVPGSKANDLKLLIESLKNRTAFAQLQTMRDNSPTGGAVGQLSDGERGALGSIFGPFDISSTASLLLNTLGKAKDANVDIIRRLKAALNYDIQYFRSENPQAFADEHATRIFLNIGGESPYQPNVSTTTNFGETRFSNDEGPDSLPSDFILDTGG